MQIGADDLHVTMLKEDPVTCVKILTAWWATVDDRAQISAQGEEGFLFFSLQYRHRKTLTIARPVFTWI